MRPGLRGDSESICRPESSAVPALGSARDAAPILSNRYTQPLVSNSKPISLPIAASMLLALTAVLYGSVLVAAVEEQLESDIVMYTRRTLD